MLCPVAEMMILHFGAYFAKKENGNEILLSFKYQRRML